MQPSNFDFKNIASKFVYIGEFLKAEPYGFGHINDTFVVWFKKSDGMVHRYILQRINHKVFKDPVNLMKNIESVTLFLREKIVNNGGDPTRETLNLIYTSDGKSFFCDDLGNYWRSYIFVEGATTYQVVENAKHMYSAGKAFGNFQKLLSDYPVNNLHETIQNFHHTNLRYKAFEKAVLENVVNRVESVADEIAFVDKRASETGVLIDLLDKGEVPLRVTHNDTKFNNVMIDDQTGEGVCVIDLDTAMPGLSLYDYGDSIRSGANTALEDEKDLSKVEMDLTYFQSFTQGFLSSVGDTLTPSEIEYLPFAAKLMTLECGMRFLTDYLNGDTYFKVEYEGHNLDRCRTQFKLVTDMEAKSEKMKSIVNEAVFMK